MAWAAIDPEGRGGPALAVGCSQAEHALCEQIPGMTFSKADRIWRAPLSWPAWVCFRTVWASQPVTIHPDLAAYGEQGWAAIQERYAMRQAIDAPGDVARAIEAVEHGGDRQLYAYQRGGVAWLARWRRGILNDPQGNGKTPMVIRTAQLIERQSPGGALPMLIICTGAMLLSWVREIQRWAPELSVRAVTGTALKRKRALEPGADVYVMAWPTVRFHTRLAGYGSTRLVRCTDHGGEDPRVTVGRCEVHEKELNAWRWQTVVVDEAHRAKDAKSKQSRAVQWLAHRSENFWALTGTLIADTIDDLWPLLHSIDPRGHPAKSRYLDLFAVKDYAWNGGGTQILGIRPETQGAFHAIVQPLIRRIPRDVARPFQPPRLDPVFRYPEMSPEQARTYKQLRKELLADLEPYTMVPANGVVSFGRLCQLAASAIEVRDGEDAQGFTTQVVELALPSSKVNDLIEFLEDNPGQLVVAANSPRLIELAERKLKEHKITHAKIVGGMSDSAKDQAAQWFQAGDVRVIFLTSRAGGESITLTAASTVYFIQPEPSFLAREQVIGRIDRIGQPEAVRIVHAITPHTVEGRLFQLGCEKEERAAGLTNDAALMRWILGDDHDEQEAQHPAPGAGA